MSNFYRCIYCRKESEAVTDEIASYFCPYCKLTTGKIKVLDQDSIKNLTEVLRSEKDRAQNILKKKDLEEKGDSNDDAKN